MSQELIMKYDQYDVYDVGYAVKRFRERFLRYSIGTFKKLLKKGLGKIKELNNLKKGDYVLKYYKRDLKIPVEITDIIKIFTVLEIKEHPIDLRDAIKVIVEVILRYSLDKSEITKLLEDLYKQEPYQFVLDLAKKYNLTIIDSTDYGFPLLIEEGKLYETWIDVIVEEE